MGKPIKLLVIKKLLMLVTADVVLIGIFEWTKQIIFIRITNWQSHTITIVFVASISSVFAFLYFRNRFTIQHFRDEQKNKTLHQLN